MNRSIGWVCPVCQVNTKDALSDIPPPETSAAEKEVLPDFMISYKSADSEMDTAEGSAVVKKDSLTENKSSQQENAAVETKTDKDETAKDKTVDDKIAKDKDIQKEVETDESSKTEKDNPIQENPHEQVENDHQQGKSVQPEQEEVVQQETVENVTAERPRSPMWLDALIGGLVSVLIALICRKYAM